MTTYKRLTLAQRYLIQTLDKQKQSQQFIAQQVGVSQSTICRELAKVRLRNPGQPYQAEQAQQRAVAAKSRLPYKLNGDLLTTIINRLRDRLSPEQICGELHRKTNRKRLHHETIYRYIYRHQNSNTCQSIDHEPLIEYLRIRPGTGRPAQAI